MALLGCGFDPGVTNIFCAYAQKHLSTRSTTIDIVDCNAGNHGKAFATNFNPEINIREVTQRGKLLGERPWIEIDPLSMHVHVRLPEVGPRKSYLIYHEELECLVKNIRGLKQIRFWMTFGRQLHQAPRRAAERRHDPHRPGHVRGPASHPDASS